MLHITIDQAGKIENTSEDTILALSSNEIQYSIRIPKILKQEIFNQCKKRHKKNLTFRIFSYGLYLLLKDKIKKDSIIIIDDEYPKHGRDIKQNLLRYFEFNKDNIRFDLVGKKDPSHRIANKTFSGKLKPNEIITKKQLNLFNIASKNKIKKLLK